MLSSFKELTFNCDLKLELNHLIDVSIKIQSWSLDDCRFVRDVLQGSCMFPSDPLPVLTFLSGFCAFISFASGFFPDREIRRAWAVNASG